MQNIKIFTLLVLLFCSTTFCSAQSTYPNDPLQRRIYVLDNGLTVCLSENHREPRIACALAIRAGSGIETDSTRSLAFLAAKNLLSDEYTQLMKTWNAAPPEVAVSYDWCTMLEEFPANYLEQWTVLLHERLDHPAFRLSTNNLFRITDMINGAQRNDHQRAYDTLRSALYPNHPYGLPFTDSLSQQLEDTTISKLTDFYLKHYTPSNIILCLSGDFHTKEVLNLIDKHLGKLQSSVKPSSLGCPLPPVPRMCERHLAGDLQPFILLGYRLDLPNNPHNQLMLNLISKILYNKYCGLIDQLPKNGPLRNGFALTEMQSSSSLLILTGHTRDSLQATQARDSLQDAIAQLKAGAFSDQLFKAAQNQLKLELLQQCQHNSSRARLMLESFQRADHTPTPPLTIAQCDAATKREVVDFANKFLHDNYVIVYKAQGATARPDRFLLPRSITTMKHNESECALISQLQDAPPPPKATPAVPIQEQTEGLFTLSLTFPTGELHDMLLPYAASYWQNVGTQQYSPHERRTQWFKIACQCEVSCSDKTTTIKIHGLEKHTEAAIRLLADQMLNAVPDTHALRLLVDKVLQQRKDAKKSLASILNCLRNYCEYEADLIGYQLKEEQIRNLDGTQLLNAIRQLWQYQPEIQYSGSLSDKQIRKLLVRNAALPKQPATPPSPTTFARAATPYSHLFFLPYTTRNAHIVEYQCSEEADTSLATLAKLYSEYFGNGNPSVLRQHLSRKGCLSGNCSAAYIVPQESDGKMYSYTYLTVPVDKIAEAIATFDTLDQQLAVDPDIFNNARQKANAPDYKLEDVLNFHHRHIANRPKILMIIAPEDAREAIKATGIPFTSLTLEDIFGY